MGLATIQQVNEIREITGATNVEMARILGWWVMVRKNTMKVGDLVVYFEIDSLLPDIPQFNFLASKGFPYRLKTEKYFKGTITSQGLALPISDFQLDGYDIGDDVTELLNIAKYEKTIDPHLMGDAKGVFPSFLIKTDETRLQAIPSILEYLKDNKVYISLKCDGTSATYAYNKYNNEFMVCSRNMERPNDNQNIYSIIANKYSISNILKETTYAIQGEICGKAIQGNPLNIAEYILYVFNVYDYQLGEYLSIKDMVSFCESNNIHTVPILDMDIDVSNWGIEDFIEYSKGKYPDTDNQREGIVVRTMTNRYCSLLGGRVSFKVINPDYKD